MHRSVAILLLFPLLTCGCAFTPKPYVPSTGNTLWGYAETPVRPGYFEVTYIGLEGAGEQTTRYFALLRAAELAIQAGKPAFEVAYERPGKGTHIERIPAVESCETITNPDGTTCTEWVETEPAREVIQSFPLHTLLIHLLDAPAPNALTVAPFLRDAQKSHTRLAPQTLAALDR
jgi:hypothetical protein